MSTRVPRRSHAERFSNENPPDVFQRIRARRQRQYRKFLVFASLSGIALAAFLSSRARNANPPVIAKAQAAPVRTPTPKPKPTPKNAIPKWAKGQIIKHVPVKPGRRVIALTFDDGPWPHYSAQVMKALEQYDAKATFYVVGQEVGRRPQIARQMRDAGHDVASHSWDHPMHPRDPVAQITRTNQAIKHAVGLTPTTYRPPYGMIGNGMARKFMNDGGAVIMWSADSHDWKRPGAQHIASSVLRHASPGGIVLMHDGGGRRGQTVAALHTILRVLNQRGYKFVTVPELLAMRYVAPKPAKKEKPKLTQKHEKKTASHNKPKVHATPKPHATPKSDSTPVHKP